MEFFTDLSTALRDFPAAYGLLAILVVMALKFYGWHVALGYVVGPSATTLLERLHLPGGPVILGLALLGLVAWLVLRGRRKAGAAPEASALDRLHSWTEAACPACLAVTALQQLTPRPMAEAWDEK